MKLTNDIKKKLTFITENASNLNYDNAIDELFQNVFDSTFNNALNVYASRGLVTYTKFRLFYNKTIDENVKAFNGYLKMIKLNLDLFRECSTCNYLFSSHYFRRTEIGFSISGSYHIHFLIYFLRYLTNEKFDKDLHESIDFAKNADVRSDASAYSFTIGNISVKRFMNGRLDLKGLTQKQQDTIDRVSKTYEILRRL